MEKNEAEKIIKETVEYADKEIKKAKKKCSRTVLGVIVGLAVIIAGYFIFTAYETPVKYADGVASVSVPADGGLDIRVNLPNYKRANAVLVEAGKGFDLYISLNQTLYTKAFESDDSGSCLLRAGNGIVVDYKSDRLLEYIPDGKTADAINRIYYIDNPSEDFSEYDNATLVWER